MPKGSVTTRWLGGGGRRPFEVDSFHAAPIGIMLKFEILGGHVPVPPGGGALVYAPPKNLLEILPCIAHAIIRYGEFEALSANS